MSHQISLRKAEQKVFRTTYNDGLWDIFLGCFFSIFAIAPYLSASMGDFWSSAVFVPFWGFAFVVIWFIRKYVSSPRIGSVEFGPARKTKLKKFSAVMFAINIVAFILGMAAGTGSERVSGQTTSIIFGLIILVIFSVAAYFLEFNRLYLYGLLLGLSPLIGEWLYTYHHAVHHGFPITFGISVTVMILVGVVMFVRLLRHNPASDHGISSGAV